jgi:hypothetical protein
MEGSSNQILKLLQKNSGKNKHMQAFLEDLLNLEMEQPGWYNDRYKAIIDKYYDKGGLPT